MLPLLALLLPSALAQDTLDPDPAPQVVTVPLSALEPAPELPPAPPVALAPTRQRIALVPGPETLVDLELEFDVFEAGTWALEPIGRDLALRSATLDGRPVALPPGDLEWRQLVAPLAVGRHLLRIQGSVATPRPELVLPVSESPRTRLDVAGSWDLAVNQGVPTGDGAWALGPVSELRLSWQPPAPPAPRPQVILAQAATALRVDTAGIEARAQVQATVLHQATDRLVLRLPPVAELDVQGPAVAGFQQQGDRVEVRLSRPLTGRIDLSLSYRAPPPSAEGAPAPLPVPETTSGRLEAGWVSVQAGDQGTVVPEAGRGLAAVPSAAVPAWGKGLVAGATVANLALTGPRPELTLRVLDLSPADAPGTFVDEARYEVAHAAHGRALVRCRYQVRNDRNQYLGLALPAGAVPLGVRVAGTVVQPVRDGDHLYVPLEKSVETLTGLVTFPVELSLLVPEEPWERRGQRTLSVPAVDAPVAHARWELVLPPGASSRRVEGTPTLVEDEAPPRVALAVTRATAVGSGTLDSEEAEETRRERSQEAWNSAYRAYQDNQFDVARGMLEQSLAWDADNRAAQDLMGNVEVLLGEGEKQDDGQARRIRAMARAKTQGLEGEQSEKKREAEAAIRAGDYEAARETLSELAELTEQLAVVEDVESVDQKAMLEDTRRQLAEVEEQVVVSKKKAEVAERREEERRRADKEVAASVPRPEPSFAPAAPPPPPPVQAAPANVQRSYDIAGEDIAGELSVPSGSFTVVLDGVAAEEADRTVGRMVEELRGLGYVETDELEAPEPEPVAAAPAEPPRRVVQTSGLSSRAEILLAEGKDGDAFDDIDVTEDRLSQVAARHDGPGLGGHISLSWPRRKEAERPAEPPAERHPLRPPPPPRDPRTVPTAEAMDPAVTAAPLSVRPPRAGQRLLLEQRLLAPDAAPTITLTYRFTD